MQEIVIPVVVVIAVIQILNTWWLYSTNSNKKELDKKFTDISSRVLEVENDMMTYEDKRDSNCRIHTEKIASMELEIGKRKGESELLQKDIQNLKDTVDLKLQAIKESQAELKSLIEKIYAKIDNK